MPMQTFFPNETIESLAKRMIRRITREQHLEGFTNRQVRRILRHARHDFGQLDAMIEVSVPVVIFGDIHGQLADLLRYFAIVGTPEERQMLFLGDYVDRGPHSFEVIMLLLCYKLLHPNGVHLLRGNHECSKMNRLYGFHEELGRKRTTALWKPFQDVFSELPLCANVGGRILCMHGGISEHVSEWQSLRDLKKPKTPKQCDEGIALDLMWADPTQEKCSTFAINTVRAISVIFGEKGAASFMEKLNLDMVVRAHEVSRDGYTFFFNRRLVTVFSAPFYCGNDGNSGAIMQLSNDFVASFIILRPKPTPTNQELVKILEANYEVQSAPSPDPRRSSHRIIDLNTQKPESK